MVADNNRFQTRSLSETFDVLAPDGSEIRLLVNTPRCSMAHGTLPPGGVSLAVSHRTVEEVWYVTAGEAEIWRQLDGAESVTHLRAGDSLTLPLGTAFQIRSLGVEPFCFVMVTFPPWPGPDEARLVTGKWPADPASDGLDR